MEQRVRRAPSRQVRYMRSRQVWYMPVGRCPFEAATPSESLGQTPNWRTEE